VRRLTIAGLIAALTVGSFVLVASAQTGDPAPFWPATTNGPIAVTEWYSDLPWHQKLGTFSGNEIDEALILPYDALPGLEKTFCTNNQLTPEACMIETGINNILGTQRTDTPYSTTDPKIMAATECQQSPPCIEVKLELSSFWTRSTGSAITLQQRPFGTEPPTQSNPGGYPYYGGYAITDGTTYAPTAIHCSDRTTTTSRIRFATATTFLR
jgi:hypothetical protein